MGNNLACLIYIFYAYMYMQMQLWTLLHNSSRNDFGVELPEEIDSNLHDMTITQEMLEQADTDVYKRQYSNRVPAVKSELHNRFVSFRLSFIRYIFLLSILQKACQRMHKPDYQHTSHN